MYHDKNLSWENHPMDKQNNKPNSIEAALGPRMHEDPLPEPTQDEILAQALNDARVEERLLQPMEPETKSETPMTSSATPGPLPTDRMATMKLEDPPIIVTFPEPETTDYSQSSPERPLNKMETPVSNDESQPVITPYFPESVEPPQKLSDENLTKVAGDIKKAALLKNFDEWGPKNPPAEDIELIKFMEYLDGDNFAYSSVAFQLRAICGNPQVIPVMSQWQIPPALDVTRLVYDILLSPGYIESIWPVLKILLGTNIGNSVWTGNIATTLAVFDAMKLFPLANATEKLG
jgi:hypothetical protein